MDVFFGAFNFIYGPCFLSLLQLSGSSSSGYAGQLVPPLIKVSAVDFAVLVDREVMRVLSSQLTFGS